MHPLPVLEGGLASVSHSDDTHQDEHLAPQRDSIFQRTYTLRYRTSRGEKTPVQATPVICNVTDGKRETRGGWRLPGRALKEGPFLRSQEGGGGGLAFHGKRACSPLSCPLEQCAK